MTDPRSAKKIQLIVGLGNPGAEYANTRHNVGYWFVEQLCNSVGKPLSLENKFKGSVSLVDVGRQSCRILQPLTYMNCSGSAVLAMAQFYKILPQEILVVHDELDLPPGTARLKMDGGHGGHNGLRDIIAQLNTREFYRLRIGIGHPGVKNNVSNYVLHRPSVSDHQDILTAIHDALAVLPDIVAGNIAQAMQKLHTVPSGE